MCPWPRIQAALTDEHALNVTYRYDRGEPRGSLKKSEALRAQGCRPATASTASNASHVCPTGVDIRDGPQLDCIQCGLCIDACDDVMAKIGRPTRLIAYDTDVNIQRAQEGKRADLQASCARARCSMPRSSRIVGGIMMFTLATRTSAGHQRHPRSQSDVRAPCRRRRSATATRCASQQGARAARVRADASTGCPASQVDARRQTRVDERPIR